MISFCIGLVILVVGYLFYSPFIERLFGPTDQPTPAVRFNDHMDFVPMSTRRVALIQLLNIAGMGPLLGAIQGILFGPIAFILIPLGCVLMGGVHDYLCGMISLRNDGMQVTGLIQRYLGKYHYYLFLIVVSIMLLLLAGVFVYTSGDVLAEVYFKQHDFSLNNPVMIIIYGVITAYFIMAAVFPIDKIIGRFYPIFGFLLIVGTIAIMIGLLISQVPLQEINFKQLNQHPQHLALIPFFFMTVSCGLLSGFHSTQSTIVSRTIQHEREGRTIFFGMMCLESLIAMIWAAGAMAVYNLQLVPPEHIGRVHVLNVITKTFVPYIITLIVTATIVILPITSGDTALRSLRLALTEALQMKATSKRKILALMFPILLAMIGIVVWAKHDLDSFNVIWRYFTFVNQVIAVLTFCYATVFLYQRGKTVWPTLIPAIFYIFVTISFISNNKIGLGLSQTVSYIIASVASGASVIWLIWWMKDYKQKNPLDPAKL